MFFPKRVDRFKLTSFQILLNIGFNALFVYAFKMGIAGVALGTLLARIFPAGFTLGLMSRKRNLVRIKIFENSA